MKGIFKGLTDTHGIFPNQGTGNSATSTEVITRMSEPVQMLCDPAFTFLLPLSPPSLPVSPFLSFTMSKYIFFYMFLDYKNNISW